jgi:predicted lipoprotein with Yx(FWY)xxD motif
MLKKAVLAVVATAALAAAGVAAAAVVTHPRSLAVSSSGSLVTLHKTSLGKVLATSSGMTLYLYTPDPKGKSVCNAGCDTTWPPLTTKGKPHAGMGLKQSLLGTTRRSNGKLQVTYKGHPLYRFTGDAKAGQDKGEGYGGIWFVVSAAGKKIAPAQPPTTTSGGGYGGGTGY